MKIFFIHIRNPFKRSGKKPSDPALDTPKRILNEAIKAGRGKYPSTVKLAVRIAKEEDKRNIKPG